MDFSHLEWIHLPNQGKLTSQPTPSEPKVVQAIICPHCGWIEEASKAKCFRCGGLLQSEHVVAGQVLDVDVNMPEKTVDFDPLTSVSLIPSEELTREQYLLRLMGSKLNMAQGFDRLMSVNQLNIQKYPYQLDTVKRVLRDMRGQALLADEVGLGKTIEAGMVIRELLVRGLVKNILIVVPASLLYQWQSELADKFHESFEVMLTGDWGKTLKQEPNRVIVSLSRAKLKPYAAHILKKEWDLLIVDEAHKLKNRSTIAYRFINAIRKRYVLLLTATPVHNELSELYSLITILKPGYLGTLRRFRRTFVDSGDSRNPRNAPALRKLLKKVMIRNQRTKVGIKIPARRAAILHLELPQPERKLYDDVSAFIRASLQSSKNGMVILSLMTLQRELTSSPAALASTLDKMSKDVKHGTSNCGKLARLAKRAKDIHVGIKIHMTMELLQHFPGKFIIFTEFRKTQEVLAEFLKQRGISSVLYHGGLNGMMKEEAIEQFKGDTRILVSTESGGEGRNLQFCHQMINFDLPWNPMRLEQRIGRIHRLGQTKEVLLFNFSTKDTLEQYLINILAKKIRMFELVVGELDLILGTSDEKDTFMNRVRTAWEKTANEEELAKAMDAVGDEFASKFTEYSDLKNKDETLYSQLFEGDEKS